MGFAKKHKQIFALVFIIMPQMQAWYYAGRVIEPKSRVAFFKHLNNAQLAVVQLYERIPSCSTHCMQNPYSSLKQRLGAVSQNQRFNYAHLSFILMDVSCDPCLTKDLGVSHVPTVLLFIDGRPALDGQTIARLDGIYSEIALNQFIEAGLSKELEAISCERAQHEREVEQAKLAAWANWAPYWYLGCYRPGWGWSARCGWGWGCGGCW